MKTIAYKITRTAITIAICWFIAYGIGSAVSHCCGANIKICSPSEVRGPLISANDIHSQPSQSHNLYRLASVDERAKSIWHDFDEHSACCPATPCASTCFTAITMKSSPSSTWLQAASNTSTVDYGHSTFEINQNRCKRYHPTIPIFLLTKSIIC